jgi:hypothetical protein
MAVGPGDGDERNTEGHDLVLLVGALSALTGQPEEHPDVQGARDDIRELLAFGYGEIIFDVEHGRVVNVRCMKDRKIKRLHKS